MELVGQIDLNATPEAIWVALFDPAVLQGCFPGCKSVERKSEAEYAAVLQVKVTSERRLSRSLICARPTCTRKAALQHGGIEQRDPDRFGVAFKSIWPTSSMI